VSLAGTARAARREERDRAAVEEGVATRLAALDRVLAAADGRLDDDLLAPARLLARRAGERLGLSGQHTVVALAGATGSGKSSLFNALAGMEVSTVGVRRPTTGVAHACVWGPDGAEPLLDWLGIPRRHQIARESVLDGDDEAVLRGLVLLDLPDHDSTEVAHRLEVDRLVALVDVLVWVLDPQKYADAAVHDRYLRPLAGHGDVMVVVLNQVDRLSAEHARECVADIRRLLAEDGLPGVPVLTTSATSPGGLEDLRLVLTDAVAARRAALRRVSADLDGTAAALAPVVGGPAREEVDRATTRSLVAALGTAAGVPVAAAAVERAYAHRAVQATGWPFTRWVRRLRPDPLRRLHLDLGSGRGAEPLDDGGRDRDRPRALPGALPGGADGGVSVARTSLPQATAVQRSRVDGSLRALAHGTTSGLPAPWPDLVRQAARSRADDLPDALDRAVAATDLGLGRTPWWWRTVGALQAVLAGLVLGGAVWLAGLYALTALRLPEPRTPELGTVPVPTVLLVGGLVGGVLLALLSRLLARLGARRRRLRAEARLRDAVSGVVRELVLAPVRAELRAYAEVRDGVEVLARR